MDVDKMKALSYEELHALYRNFYGFDRVYKRDAEFALLRKEWHDG